MTQVVCRISNVTNVTNDDFEKVIRELENLGYHISWENYPYTCLAEIEKNQNEGE